jgi:hypothetical protein
VRQFDGTMEAAEFKSMESNNKSGNLSCDDVREMLSDLIDARRGEIPHPDGTQLSTAGMRPMVELHLAGCAPCRDEMKTLEEVGAAFRDFSVGELPAQMFAEYGQKVRARMAGDGVENIVRVPQRSWRRRAAWLAMTTSGVAAACLALIFGLRNTDNRHLSRNRNLAVAESEPKRHIVQATAGIQYHRPTASGFETVSLRDEAADLQEVQRDEGRYGSLTFSVPLLGVFMKTTRDADSLYGRQQAGLMVARVVPGGPADMMGLQPNDIIVTLNTVDSAGNNHEMLAMRDGGAAEAISFLKNLKLMGAGTTANLHIVREVQGQYLFLTPTATLGEYQIQR